MKSNGKLLKSKKYLLFQNHVTTVHLSIPTASAKEQKYYLEYLDGKPIKYYSKGNIKLKAIKFFEQIKHDNLSEATLLVFLFEVFEDDINFLISRIGISQQIIDVNLRTKVEEALKMFFSHKELQKQDGTVNRISLYGYKHHHIKLLKYFQLKQFSSFGLNDLNSIIWLQYRVDMLKNTYGFNKKQLKNSSINQHFQYIHQFYSWLIDYNDLPIKNHLNKLKKLNESQQDKRFKVIDDDLLNEFYRILETHEKYYFTRLYLSALFLYENNIRLSEQVLIKVSDINIDENKVRIVNNKNHSSRTVIISDKTKELIEIIKANTERAGIEVMDEMFLIGGHNIFKSGIPHGQKELGVVMRRFRKKYPQFAGRTLYEHKHTSITHQFNNGIDSYKIKERANHSSIKTTEIYLQSNKLVHPFVLKFNDKP